ncbi:hypothetical protein PV772_19140 [Pseudarthrobacter sp. CC12]|uniref:hypothetical protein n=1 Tax=Pseudarthrobacter sp. CC12 TaxID=3029193 RepID=UPI00326662B4
MDTLAFFLLILLAGVLFGGAFGLWWLAVPLVSRCGLTVTTLGGLIAWAFVAAVAALLVGGLAALMAAIS